MPTIAYQDDSSLAAFLQATVPMAEADAATCRFLRVNDAFCRLTGRTAEELTGLTYLDLTHPADRERDREIVERCLATNEQHWSSEKRYVRPDGTVRWVLVLGVVMRVNGRPWRTIALLEDITARKQAELAARSSEQLFRVAQELSQQAFTVLRAVRNGEGQIVDFEWTYANPVAHGLLRRPVASLVGKRLLEELPGHRESGLFDLYVGTVETGDPATREVRYEADGIEGWFSNSTIKLEDGVAVSFWDITPLKRAEQAREELLAEAREANRLKDEFLSTLSHELRTPLNAILGWSQLLQGATDETVRRHGLQAISRNASAQSRLVEDILDVSRIASGQMSLELRPMELTPVLKAAVAAVRPLAEAKGLALESAIETRARVNADGSRLEQIFWNVLSNAVKFTPAGGIDVRVETDRNEVHVVIEDTGIGIDAGFLPSVFDRFSQADGSSTRQYGGLGLGLAIVRQLTELHGGRVEATSAGPGAGARFTITLPRADRGEPRPRLRARRAPAEGADAAPGGDLEGLSILVVDDDVDELELLHAILQTKGARVTTAASAVDAFAAFEREAFDVVISDIAMPGEDGYSLLRRIRALPASAGGGVCAIALTAYAHSHDRMAALTAGFHQHVAKPVSPTELTGVVLSLVKHTRPTKLG